MLRKVFHTPIGAVVANMFTAYVMFMLSRVVFFLVNYHTFAEGMSWDLACHIFQGALVFDTSALLYINSLYLVLMLLPIPRKEVPAFHRGLKWLFVLTNALGVASNLMDSVYVQYTGRRSTVTVFTEFVNENNIASIIATEFVNHWYLVVLFVLMVAGYWLLFVTPRNDVWGRKWRYYLVQSLALVVLAPLAIIGIRGSATAGTRPITISNANEYVNRPIESTIVLNTPFSLIRSIGKKAFVTPDYMPVAEMEAVYSPVQNPEGVSTATAATQSPKNVVVMIVESMGKEYIGAFNKNIPGYKGYMPFIDSLVGKSLTFEYSFANGRISMDAMPSILCGIPMMVEPYFLTPASLNDVKGLPSLMAEKGYSSAFFHGGHNISMGFSAFAHTIGYERYFGLNEYCRSPKYGAMDDFDGKWAIWDEPFLQYTLDELHTLRQPFVASVFTASSHHPYRVPAQYKDVLKEEGGQPIHKCVRYADMALRKFFERAQKEAWYKNTIFVLVADHTNLTSHPFYATDQGLYSVPILFYAPDGSLPAQLRSDVIAQQTDILPTLLGLLGYDKPYIAFGCDLLKTPAPQTWAFNYNNGIYQYFKGDYLLQFNGTKSTALYAFKTDPLLKKNLLTAKPGLQATALQQLEKELKALIQQYMMRMNTNTLTLK